MATKYIQVENLSGYVTEVKKWKAILELCKTGFPVGQHLSEYVDTDIEEIYDNLEAQLNNIFVNTDENVKSYNAFEGMHDFVEKLNEGDEVGLPLYNAPILTDMISGFNLNGHIYGLGANSGVGKSTMVFNYLVPTAIEQKERMILIINEEDETKVKRELLIWVANNIFKVELQKHTLRDGHFDKETMELLIQCSNWIEERKNEHILTIIPLERYTVGTVIKIIKKYSSLGIKMFVLDTFKESQDAKTDEIFKSMMRDMVKLYDVVKPKAKNVGLFVTYQLGKNSLQVRHFTNNNIGQAKSIIDPMSVNIMMRRPFDDEFDGKKNQLECKRLEGKNKATKIPFTLDNDKKYMITFVLKNRFGDTDPYQIISECDLSRNVCRDLGICYVPQDW